MSMDPKTAHNLRPGQKVAAAHKVAAPAMGDIARVLEQRRGITPERLEAWASRFERAAEWIRSIPTEKDAEGD